MLDETGDLDGLCGRLIDAAKAAGGHDNVTACLVKAVWRKVDGLSP